MGLEQIIDQPARDRPDQPALLLGGGAGALCYAQLDRLSDRLRDRLIAMGITRGQRVGIWLQHRLDTVAAILGILKVGAVCVPLDPACPPARNAFILHNSGARLVIIEKEFEARWLDVQARLDGMATMRIVLESSHTSALADSLDALDAISPAERSSTTDSAPNDPAYLLYISGADGKPRGVMLSHGNVLALLETIAAIVELTPEDVVASYAPVHRDLALLEMLLPLKHGARAVLIPREAAGDPTLISRIIAAHRITIWHSTPPTLSLLAQFGNIAEHDYSSLRMILFTGEPFSLVHLRAIKRLVPSPRYFNLYGSTETGMCTCFEIPREVPSGRTDGYPIGKACQGISAKLVDAAGHVVSRGIHGELCIAGPIVSSGYWQMPEQSARAFLADDGSGVRWYRTGDIAVEDSDGNYCLAGRRDRMVKRRGQRVELAEIEAVLQSCSAIREAALMAIPDSAAGVKLIAHVSFRVETRLRLSPSELKAFCAERLPAHMVPDLFSFHVALPRTTMERIDYAMLKRL